ncbi:MAG: hypothetical protein KGN34_12325 [Sphingomonadales bacterium]|nr:hypothetical protein [Sphingomonadales bacterium]
MYQLTTDIQRTPLRPDGSATRHALMVAGEYLMGEQGLDTPPLHVIAAEAGQSNRYAVQYHFADRKGLVHGIMMKRNESIRQRRAELALEAATMGIHDDVRALVEAMFLPVIEQVGDRESSSYVRLLMQWLNLPWQHDLMQVRQDVADDMHTGNLLKLFHSALPHLTREQVGWRLRIQSRHMLTCLVEHDNLSRMGMATMTDRDMILQAFAMVSAAMLA